MSRYCIKTWRAEGQETSLVLEASVPIKRVVDTLMVPSRGGMDMSMARRLYAEEGRRICQALKDHLPGGLFDALLGAMLAEKASVFIVAHSNASPQRSGNESH